MHICTRGRQSEPARGAAGSSRGRTRWFQPSTLRRSARREPGPAGEYVSMRTWMYVRTYVCVHVCMHARTRVCEYACMHARTYVCVHVCVCACMHACMNLDPRVGAPDLAPSCSPGTTGAVCVCVCVCVCIHACISPPISQRHLCYCTHPHWRHTGDTQETHF